jgi:endo-1,4-beta-xylanase
MTHRPMLSRRDALAALGAGAAASLCAMPALAQDKATTGLNAAAAKSGRRFGSAVAFGPQAARRGSFANPDYARLLERDCGILVPENEMKWQALRPDASRYDFRRFDAIMDYARARGMAVRGHTLLWHRPKWFPKWLNEHDFGARPASAAEAILTGHIETVTQRYRGRIVSYDVVNEAVDPETGQLVQTSLSKAFGSEEGLLDLAFRTARANAPGVELVYNDYMGWEADNATHRKGVLKLLEAFRKRGTPVDALGIQAHLGIYGIDPATGLGRHDAAGWKAFLDEATAMGYGLVITELDVKDHALPADFAARDKGVADFTRAFMEMMLSYEQLGDVLVWGMSDAFSWLQGFSPREDKRPLRCCPYDADFKPKPMHDALMAAFAAVARG